MPKELGMEGLFMIAMEKELVFFDEGTKNVMNHIEFNYSKMKDKIL